MFFEPWEETSWTLTGYLALCVRSKMLKSQIRSCYCLPPEPPLISCHETDSFWPVSFCTPRHWLESDNLQGFILSEIPMQMWCASQSALGGGEIAPVSKGGNHSEVSSHTSHFSVRIFRKLESVLEVFGSNLSWASYSFSHTCGPQI